MSFTAPAYSKTLSEAVAECQANLPPDINYTDPSADGLITGSRSNKYHCRTFGKGEHSLSGLYYESDSYNDGTVFFFTGADVALYGLVTVTGPAAMMELNSTYTGQCNDVLWCAAHVVGITSTRFTNQNIYPANDDDICPLDGSSPNDNAICLPQDNLNDDPIDAGEPPCDQGEPGTFVGNPCNPSTGNKFQLEHDYDGVVKFDRYYNSITRWQADESLPTDYCKCESSRLAMIHQLASAL